MLIVPPSGPTLRGIDIYHGNVVTDFSKVIDSGISYIFVKASEHECVDKAFKPTWDALQKTNVVRGAYAYFHPDADPIKQANCFIETVGQLSPRDLPPMLDFEILGGETAGGAKESAQIWLDTVEKAYGRRPIIYGSPYFLLDLKLDVSFALYPLFIANYGVDAPKVPSPWKSWAFWQTSENGTVPGIEGAVDLSVFNGDENALKCFCGPILK